MSNDPDENDVVDNIGSVVGGTGGSSGSWQAPCPCRIRIVITESVAESWDAQESVVAAIEKHDLDLRRLNTVRRIREYHGSGWGTDEPEPDEGGADRWTLITAVVEYAGNRPEAFREVARLCKSIENQAMTIGSVHIGSAGDDDFSDDDVVVIN